MIVTIEELKEYLRIDEDDTSNDDVILSSLDAAEMLCLDIARCTEEESETRHAIFHEAVLYAAAFMYEHREEADYSALLSMLRTVLFAARKSRF